MWTPCLPTFRKSWARCKDGHCRPFLLVVVPPSLLSPESYQRLLPELNKRVPFARDIEITLEANPGTYEYGTLSGLF